MTLTDLYDRLDWSALDQSHAQWQEDNAEGFHLENPQIRRQREENLYGLLILLKVVLPKKGEAPPDQRVAETLPHAIRNQVWNLLIQEKMISVPPAN